MYLVKYSSGSHDDYHQVVLFVTSDERVAKDYVERFNSVFGRFKEYYKKFNSGDNRWVDGDWIGDEYAEDYFDRWYFLQELHEAYYEEIEER